MAEYQTSIKIDAPVEKVFGFLSDPQNLPEIWPSIIEVKDVTQLPNGGTSFRYVYKMAGIRLEGSSEDIEFVPNERTVNKSKGGIEATQIWTFQPEDGGTKFVFDIKYNVPIPLLGKLAEAIVLKMNEGEANLVLANLKARMEA
jgi:ligand-binding SRPBCC domain-containing protein